MAMVVRGLVDGKSGVGDAWAHFHLDSDAHERSTVSSLLQLFEVVIERTDEAEASERTERD